MDVNKMENHTEKTGSLYLLNQYVIGDYKIENMKEKKMKLEGSLRATAKELREISRKKVSKRGGAKRNSGKSITSSWTDFREKIELKNSENLRGDDLISALEKFVDKI